MTIRLDGSLQDDWSPSLNHPSIHVLRWFYLQKQRNSVSTHMA